MIFAYRGLIGCAFGIWAPNWWLSRPPIISIVVKIVLVAGTSAAADWVTAKMGSAEKRTTNSMPYPITIPVPVQNCAKRFYSQAQVGASCLAIFSPPSIAFGCLLAIESASFLMTLRRKGIIQSEHYHTIYAATLFVMYPALLIMAIRTDSVYLHTFVNVVLSTNFIRELRLEMKLSKFVASSFGIVAAHCVSSSLVMCVDPEWLRAAVVASLACGCVIWYPLEFVRAALQGQMALQE
jgi:hypothetical protein